MTESVFEFYLKQISNLLNKKKFNTCLELCREMKARLFANPPVDPVLLGWQRFYEFINLVQMHKDNEALNLFLSNEEHPFSLDIHQMTYMTSVAAELACNLGNVKQTLKLCRLAWALSFKDNEIITRIQKAQNACIYFERLKESRLNFGFARFLTGFGKSNDIPVLYIQGLECLLANFRQSKSQTIQAILLDSLATLSEYFRKPPEKLDRTRIKELIDAINENRTFFHVTGLFDEAKNCLNTNEISRFQKLINTNTDLVYEFDEDGNTLLMEAIRKGNEKAVDILIESNADLHVVEDIQGSTPLLLAVNLGYASIARKLLDNGADPEVKGIFGQTPLIRAVIEGHCDLTALLLEYGALTDRRDESGNTAIMHAVEDEKIEIVKSLIFAGADINMKNAAGMTLVQIAENMGHEKVSRVLKQFRAR
ncbi:MAG: hypothetical protein Kow0029_28300 [Candidatus Rifleibacteriota bacterium]